MSFGIIQLHKRDRILFFPELKGIITLLYAFKETHLYNKQINDTRKDIKHYFHSFQSHLSVF